jgi:hypothetical protein
MDDKDTLAQAVNEAMDAVTKSLRPLSPALDANPGGVQQLALVAVLRAFADLLSEELPPGVEPDLKKLHETIIKVLKGQPV